jgi:hypothetical protein
VPDIRNEPLARAVEWVKMFEELEQEYSALKTKVRDLQEYL